MADSSAATSAADTGSAADAAPIQTWPALLSAGQHDPASYSFGRYELPARVIFFRSALSFASVNESPLFPGHVLVMPRSNKPRVRDLSPVELADLWAVAQHVSNVLETRLHADALTLAIQDGKAAGQNVACVHIHIIPRKSNDLANNDDIYRMLEENVPASLMAVGSETVQKPNVAIAEAPAAAAAVPHGRSADALSASTAPAANSLRESLDDVKRVKRNRDEQAVEATQFAAWLKEAGTPAHLL